MFPNPQTAVLEEVLSTAFYHQEDKDRGLPSVAHGQAAADKLSNPAAHPNVIQDVLPLIANHELAFLFQDRINTKAYATKIAANPELANNIDQLLFVNYLDLSSSLRQTGQPDFTCLNNLIISRQNYDLIQHQINQRRQSGQLPIPENALGQLYKVPQSLTTQSIADFLILTPRTIRHG